MVEKRTRHWQLFACHEDSRKAFACHDTSFETNHCSDILVAIVEVTNNDNVGERETV
jgi:hypothetical protein